MTWFEQFKTQNFSDTVDRNFFIIRALSVLGSVIVLIYLATVSVSDVPNLSFICYYDVLFEMVSSINLFLYDHKEWNDAFLILAQWSMDALGLVTLIRWMLWAKSWDLMISLGLLYGSRQICTILFVMQEPEYYLWHYPGAPSLMVSYQQQYDFFYSGHMGFATQMILYWNRFETSRWHVWLASWTWIVTFMAMICMRGHYSIDILTGCAMGHYCLIISELYLREFIDNFAIHQFRDKSKKKVESNQGSPDQKDEEEPLKEKSY